MATLETHSHASLVNFLEAIRPWSVAYADATFGFIGVRNGDVIDLLQGHLLLPNSTYQISPKHIETKSVVGGLFRLADINESHESFLLKLSTDTLDIPVGKLRLMPAGNNSAPYAFFSPYESGFEIDQPRVNKLSIMSSQGYSRPIEAVTLELRAASTPYDSIEELATDLLIPNYRRDGSFVEVTANNVAMVDRTRRVVGSSAKIAVLLAPYLDTRNCSLGYKVVLRQNVISRQRISGKDLIWEKQGDHWVGSTEFEVPAGAMLQCFASYMGHVQHHCWITDPDTFPNFLRVLHNSADADLKVLKTYLYDEKQHKESSRQFEAGIVNLLFLLGFSVNPLVGKPLEDNPDIIATTQNGNVILVECTTNQINKDAKLGKLVERAEIVRSHLKKAAFDPKVLPIVVTAKPRKAIVDVDLANEHGVIVITKEDIETYVERTFSYNDPDVLFAQWWATIHNPQRGPHSL